MSSAIDRIEKALRERYNVAQLPAHLADALAAAREGNLAPLDAVLEGRELYRWSVPVSEALAAAHDELEPRTKRTRRARVEANSTADTANTTTSANTTNSSNEPEGHEVGGEAAEHLVEGRLDEGWLRSLTGEQLRSIAESFDLKVTAETSDVDLVAAIAAEPVYIDPEDNGSSA